MMVESAVRYEWHHIGQVILDANEHLVLPALPTAPGVYRVTLTGRSGQNVPEVYIGEGGSLRTRLRNYRRPSTMYTAGHNHRLWASHLRSGGAIDVEIITAAQIVVDSRARSLPLQRASARVLVENTALALEYLAGETEVLNRDAGADARRQDRARR